MPATEVFWHDGALSWDDYEAGDLTIEQVEEKLKAAQFKSFQYSFHYQEDIVKYLKFKEVVA